MITYVYYVMVGDMPKLKAKEVVQETMDVMNPTLQVNERMWFIPIREGESHIERLQ